MIICFDLDGTLINTEKWIMTSLKKAFQNNNLKIKKEHMTSNWGSSVKAMIKKIYPHLEEDKVNKINSDYLSLRLKKISQVKPFKDSLSVLNYLTKRGYTLVLISNNSHEDIMKLLKQSKISKSLFQVIVGEDDVIKPKPFPDEVYKVEKKLNKKVACFIGDSAQDIRAARAAKTISILVKTGPKGHQVSNLKPNFIVKSLKDVVPIIEDKIYQQE